MNHFLEIRSINLKPGTRDLLKQGGASLTFLPSEDVSAWPENLRKKMERGEVAREEEEKEI